MNYVVVNGDNYDAEVFDKLAAALTSDETRQWITETYGGSVVPFVPAEPTEGETAETTETTEG